MLKVERLTKTYATAAGPLTVLREVAFSIEAGAMLAVVGPSGSGKTTLLGLCAGLDQPTAGTVTLNGTPFTKEQLIERRLAGHGDRLKAEAEKELRRKARELEKAGDVSSL